MHAIVQIGSYQYKVSEGDRIEANRLPNQDGQTLTLDKVLFFANGQDIRIGKPYLKDVEVTAKVVGQTLDEKLFAYRY